MCGSGSIAKSVFVTPQMTYMPIVEDSGLYGVKYVYITYIILLMLYYHDVSVCYLKSYHIVCLASLRSPIFPVFFFFFFTLYIGNIFHTLTGPYKNRQNFTAYTLWTAALWKQSFNLTRYTTIFCAEKKLVRFDSGL